MDVPQSPANPVEPCRFFQPVDWAACGLTSLVALMVYLFTLAPEVTLEYSGIYATSAMYPGPSVPPGHPLWVIYGWLFIHLIPCSNIAWRIGVGAATAGALTCGLIALLVSSVGRRMIEYAGPPAPKQQTAFRLVCGAAAGLGFGFDGCVWSQVALADPWPLSLLLFALTIVLLARWFFAPDQRRYLYLAAFIYGLVLTESQCLITAALGLAGLLAMGDRNLGRNMLLGMAIILWTAYLAQNQLGQLGWHMIGSSEGFLEALIAIVSVAWVFLFIQTRECFTAWKPACLCALLWLAGLSICLLLPILSMTTPPVNWAYPRRVEWLFYTLSRGQYESVFAITSLSQLATQGAIYAKIAMNDFGGLYLIAAALPLCQCHKMTLTQRGWLAGILIVWGVMSLSMLIGLNLDWQGAENAKPLFAASHWILAVLAGCGLMLIGAFWISPPVAKPDSDS